jgi:hypothetical protein
MSTIDDMIRRAVKNGLVEMTLRPCAPMGSWQAIAKYEGRRDGPWDVGVSPDLPNAIVQALNPPEMKDDGGIFG